MEHTYTKIMKNSIVKGLSKAMLAFAFLFSANTASAQLLTQTSTLAQWLDKFVGSNVTIINPTITCPTGEFGIFDNGGTTNLGLNGGVILSTTLMSEIPQPHTVQAAVGGTGPGHPVLTAICGFPTFNACIVEFDFTAELDTISTLGFDYVFGSDEYNEYACSSFNDPFAFIISGPGIVGNQNIATVPGTSIPVTINSVNAGNNINFNCTSMGPGAPFTQYFVNNQALNGQFIVFDGFTTVLTAEALIQPCDTYHMFIGIANASDNGWQSGVFLRENSFTVDSTTTDLSGVVESSGGYLVEGCTPTDLIYTHDTSLGRPKKICFHYDSYLGAINGTDYTGPNGLPLPDTLLIPGNVYSGSLTIVPMLDGIQETFNTWDPVTGYLSSTLTDTIVIYEINCCTLDTLNPKDSIKIPIRDSLYMNLISRDTFYCEDNVPPTELHVTGDPLYNYLWTPPTGVADPTDTLTSAIPTQTTTYTITASYPGCPPVSREIEIILEPLPIVNVTPDDVALCLTEPYQINTTVDPPNSPYAYSWSPADGNLSSTTIPNPTFWYQGAGVFTYTLSVTTPHGCLGTDSMRIEAFPGVVGDIRISDTVICSNDSLVIDVTVFPDSMTNTSTYQWSPSTFLNNDQIMEPTYKTNINEDQTYIYTLITTNSFGCHDTDQISIRSLILPELQIMPDTALCLHEPTIITMDVGPAGGQFTYQWTPTDLIYGASDVQDPYFWTTFNTDHADYQLYAVVTEVTGGCRNYDTINIHTYPHTFLDIVADQTAMYGDRVQLWANNTGVSNVNYYAWTPTEYLDNPNIGTPTALVQVPVVYTVIGLNEWGCRDTANTTVSVDYTMNEFVPSVFSPNGDGKNDIFRIINLKYQKLVEFRVFNRWGKEIYNNPDPTKGWDGTYNGVPQDPGVYNYVIRVNVPSAEQKVFKGNITLVR